MHLQHARLREPIEGREHILSVYGARDQLICWCGPYTTEDAYKQAQVWGSAGWSWPGGRIPAALRPVKERQKQTRQGIVVRLRREAERHAARIQAEALVA